MKKKTMIILAIIFCVVLAIGGKMYMDRENDKKELIEIQKDLANYLYNNYTLYTKDNSESNRIKEEYDNGRGSLTEEEYISQIKEARIYVSIDKIEFKEFSTVPINTVRLYFTINEVYDDDVSLDTVSAETNNLIYNIGEYNGDGPYYLEKKKEKTDNPIPEKSIIYYEGGIK